MKHSYRFFTLLAVLTLTAVFSRSSFATVYVRDFGMTPPPRVDGKSWDTPFGNLQSAIDAAALTGDEVWVAKGSYTMVNLALKPGVRIYGGFTGTETDRSQRDITTNQTIIIAGSYDSAGTGIIGASSSEIDGFIIVGYDYGISCDSCTSMTISDSKIVANIVGISTYASTVEITRCKIIGGNTSGIDAINSTINLSSSFVAAAWSGVWCTDTTATITNNTIVGNTYAGIVCDYDNPALTITNNIIAFSRRGILKSGGSITASHNNLFGNKTNYDGTDAGDGDIYLDPKITSMELGELHILSDSPCKDAGITPVTGLPATDIEGKPRVFDGTVDIGADEFDGTPWTATRRVIYVNAVNSDPTAIRDGKSWATAYTDLISASKDTATNGAAEIWVCKGSYYTGSVLFSRQATLHLYPFTNIYGGFSGIETIRDQRDWTTNMCRISQTKITSNSTVLTMSLIDVQEYSRIDGITIGSDMFHNGQVVTIGIRCNGDNVTITNNTITNMFATQGTYWDLADQFFRGVGIRCDNSSPLVVNNLLDATYSGLDFVGESAPRVTNNSIMNCLYGLVCDSPNASPVVTNNLIACGVADWLGGGYSGITVSSGNLLFSHNDIWGYLLNCSGIPFSGDGNISTDPRIARRSTSSFIGDYSLTADSPCIDAGTNEGAPSIDMQGFMRPMDGNSDGIRTCDIGAYEYSKPFSSVKPSAANGSSVDIPRAVVTANYQGAIYVENADRSWGIRVDTNQAYEKGTAVGVAGTIFTDITTGERCIVNTGCYPASIVNLGKAKCIGPLGLNTYSVSGGQLGLQDAVWAKRWVKIPGDGSELKWMQASGLNNIGLLVKVWGKVTQIDPDGRYFYLDDGAGLLDDTKTGDISNVGVRIAADGRSYTNGQFLTVTGISSSFKCQDGKLRRLIKVETSDDIKSL